MAANLSTGKTRTFRYCGRDYTVSESTVLIDGVAYGRKRPWQIECNGEIISTQTPTRSRCVWVIHQNAVRLGDYTSRQGDGLTYSQLVSKLS